MAGSPGCAVGRRRFGCGFGRSGRPCGSANSKGEEPKPLDVKLYSQAETGTGRPGARGVLTAKASVYGKLCSRPSVV